MLAFFTIVHMNNKICWRFIPLFIRIIRFVGGLYYFLIRIIKLLAVYTIVHKNKIYWRFILLFIRIIRFVGGLYLCS